MKNLFLPVLVFVLLATACHPDPELPGGPLPPVETIYPTDTLPNLGHIHFNNPQIGQQSRYLYFSIHDAYTLSPADTLVDYRPDTLITVVTGLDTDGFTVQEYLSRGSASRHGATNVSASNVDTIYTYHLGIVQDSLKVTKPAPNSCWCTGSQLYVPHEPLPILPVTAPQTEIAGWHPTLGLNPDYQTAYVENYTHWGQTFDRLNIVLDNRDGPADGFTFLFIYAADYGLVRFGYFQTFDQHTTSGWDLLPE